MPHGHPIEVKAIENIRERHQGVGAYTLARRIANKNFNPDTMDYLDAGRSNVPTRTFYSVLSVIRRYDAKKNRMPASAAA